MSDNPNYICPSCMWQGDEPDRIECPNCGQIQLCPSCSDPVMDRKEYDKAQADNNREDELEERRLSHD